MAHLTAVLAAASDGKRPAIQVHIWRLSNKRRIELIKVSYFRRFAGYNSPP